MILVIFITISRDHGSSAIGCIGISWLRRRFWSLVSALRRPVCCKIYGRSRSRCFLALRHIALYVLTRVNSLQIVNIELFLNVEDLARVRLDWEHPPEVALGTSHPFRQMISIGLADKIDKLCRLGHEVIWELLQDFLLVLDLFQALLHLVSIN